MAKDYIGYEVLADNALRTVVREALRRVEKQGLIGSHHFYVTFKTHDPGVDIPDYLKERYPDEMTIVLQNQFWGLKVEDDSFEITLTFQKLPATLKIPFAALAAFADPAVPFGLQFRNATAASPQAKTEQTETQPSVLPTATLARETPPEQPSPEDAPAAASQVVSLDKFRKK